MTKRKVRHDEVVSATELAEMGYCEKRIVLARQHGERCTQAQRKAKVRGLAAHERYLAEGRAAATDRRCFVASCIYGPDAPETCLLRAFRDEVLLSHCWGRWLVAVYYKIGPLACHVLERSPIVAKATRKVLHLVTTRCHHVLDIRSST